MEPIYRETLRGLKTKTDLERDLEITNKIVSDIYYKTINNAKFTHSSQFRYKIPVEESECNFSRYYNSGYISNMNNILTKIRNLFPDCVVEQTIIYSRDAPEIISPERNKHPFYEENSGIMYIIIDWT
jgi:hypothetical protein